MAMILLCCMKDLKMNRQLERIFIIDERGFTRHGPWHLAGHDLPIEVLYKFYLVTTYIYIPGQGTFCVKVFGCLTH